MRKIPDPAIEAGMGSTEIRRLMLSQNIPLPDMKELINYVFRNRKKCSGPSNVSTTTELSILVEKFPKLFPECHPNTAVCTYTIVHKTLTKFSFYLLT